MRKKKKKIKDLKYTLKKQEFESFEVLRGGEGWEEIVVMEMMRNFGYAGKDIMKRLENLTNGKGHGNSIDYFLNHLSKGNQKALHDMIYDLLHAKLDDFKIESYKGSKSHFRATRGNLRFTFSPATDWGKIWGNKKPPYGFSMDIIELRK